LSEHLTRPPFHESAHLSVQFVVPVTDSIQSAADQDAAVPQIVLGGTQG